MDTVSFTVYRVMEMIVFCGNGRPRECRKTFHGTMCGKTDRVLRKAQKHRRRCDARSVFFQYHNGGKSPLVLRLGKGKAEPRFLPPGTAFQNINRAVTAVAAQKQKTAEKEQRLRCARFQCVKRTKRREGILPGRMPGGVRRCVGRGWRSRKNGFVM